MIGSNERERFQLAGNRTVLWILSANPHKPWELWDSASHRKAVGVSQSVPCSHPASNSPCGLAECRFLDPAQSFWVRMSIFFLNSDNNSSVHWRVKKLHFKSIFKNFSIYLILMNFIYSYEIHYPDMYLAGIWIMIS